MTLRNQLSENPDVVYHDNIFYQKDLTRHNSFEEAYVKLRKKENRLHSDGIVKALPEFLSTHPNAKEWQMRKSTLKKLIKYLNGSERILELGCGNGWLAYNLSTSLRAEICAVDVNEIELLQGSRVFRHQPNLCFIYGDIYHPFFKFAKFDSIVLSGTVQYFPDLQKLFSSLLELVKPTGSIYIADSPFYRSRDEATLAKQRSVQHFESLGFPDMADKYFHHAVGELSNFKHKRMYNPASFLSLIQRKIFKIPLSVFPIICITK